MTLRDKKATGYRPLGMFLLELCAMLNKALSTHTFQLDMEFQVIKTGTVEANPACDGAVVAAVFGHAFCCADPSTTLYE